VQQLYALKIPFLIRIFSGGRDFFLKLQKSVEINLKSLTISFKISPAKGTDILENNDGRWILFPTTIIT